MGIVNWFINDLSNEERSLTRDMISIAVADKEFVGEEKKAILEICKIEDISNTELIDSIRNTSMEAKIPQTLNEKKRYLLHLIRVMSVDKQYTSLELHLIEIIAKKMGISSLEIISFVIDEIKDNNINQEEGITIIESFVRYLIVTNS